MEEAREMLNKSRRDSSLMRKAISKYGDAKIMLEYYHGYDTTNSFGERVHINGLIQKLAGEAQLTKLKQYIQIKDDKTELTEKLLF